MKIKDNILITGGSGFLGKRLIATIQENEPHEVEIFQFQSKRDGSIDDINSLEKFKAKNIKHVLHLAGKTFVPDSWKNPEQFLDVNTKGTQNILEFCKNEKANLTFVSAYVYGNPVQLPITEKTPVQANNPYALSKYLAEQICEFYADYNDVKICTLRLFNVIGENQPSNFLLPFIISQILSPSNDKVELRDINPKRDYVYIDDVIQAILLSLPFLQKANSNYNVFNIAGGASFSVKEVYDIIANILESDKQLVSLNQIRKNEIQDTIADISKAQDELNWTPKYSFEEAMKKIMRHERKN